MNKVKKREPWQIAAGRYFVENSERGFSHDEYKKFVLSSYSVSERHISQFWEEMIQNPAGRQYPRNGDSTGKWIPPLELVSTITDYDELVEARKNAKQAFWLAVVAILVSGASLIVSIVK